MNHLSSTIDDLIEHHVERAMNNALTIVRDIFTTHTLSHRQRPMNSRLTLRYRSSSNHRPERKLPFYHTIPRCSLPSTKNDFIYYQSRVSSSDKIHRQRSTRDVQYSFSLHKSWSNEINSQPIRHFADDLTSQTIRSALRQIDAENSSRFGIPSVLLTTFVDQLVDQTVERAIETIFHLNISEFLENFLDEIFTDAFSIIAENEISTRSLPMPTERLDSMSNLVDNVAQRIFVHSLSSLRE